MDTFLPFHSHSYASRLSTPLSACIVFAGGSLRSQGVVKSCIYFEQSRFAVACILSTLVCSKVLNTIINYVWFRYGQWVRWADAIFRVQCITSAPSADIGQKSHCFYWASHFYEKIGVANLIITLITYLAQWPYILSHVLCIAINFIYLN